MKWGLGLLGLVALGLGLAGAWPHAAEARRPTLGMQPFRAQHAGAKLVGVILAPGTRVRPERGPRLRRVADRAQGRAWAVINGGFFNHADGQSVSWALSEGRVLADPTRNPKLVNNRALAPHLPTILHGRTAWLAFPGWPERWALGRPDRKDPQGKAPIALLQAGPSLLPYPAAEAEAFVRPAPGGGRVDAIQALGKAPRSALGLRSDGAMIWVVAQSPGLSLGELAVAMMALGATQAMALDGGSSSAIAWREGERWQVASGPAGGAAAVDTVLVAWPP